MMMHVAGGHVMMTGNCHSRGKAVGVLLLLGKANECVNTEGFYGWRQALIYCV